MGLIVLLILLTSMPVLARGRQPEAEDGFPDYNRLEYRKKRLDPVTEAPTAPPTPALPVNTRAAPPSDLDAPPKPAPAAVPIPADSSEPAMPDDMIKTLTPSATSQK